MLGRLENMGAARPVRGRRCGFTLIETLVAMTVLSLIAAVILRDVVGLRESASRFSDKIERAMIARSVLADMLANRDLKPGTYRGGADGARWTVTASAVDLSHQFVAAQTSAPAVPASQLEAPGTAAGATAIWQPQRLLVEVEAGGRPISIETIRLARIK